MRLAVVALAASVAILSAVIMNLEGDGTELPLPDVIELQGESAPDTPASALAPLEPPVIPPPPPLPQQAAKHPPVVATAGQQGARQELVNSRPAGAPVAPAPAPVAVVVEEEIRRYVTSSSTDEYRYDCDPDDEPDDDDRDECDKRDKTDDDDRDRADTKNDDDDDEVARADERK